jgi:hypothetical protein
MQGNVLLRYEVVNNVKARITTDSDTKTGKEAQRTPPGRAWERLLRRIRKKERTE